MLRSARLHAALLAGSLTGALGCTTLLGDDYFLLDPEQDPDPDGGGGGTGPGAGGGSGGAPLPKPDLAAGLWEIENASNTPATISHDGVLALAGAARWVAWAEPDDIQLGDQDIWATLRGSDGNWTPERLTEATDVQFAYPSIGAFGEVVHVVFSGNADGVNDVYWVRSSGGLWLEPANLTTGSKPPMSRHDYHASLAVANDGKLAVAYLSYPVGRIGDELRVIRFDQNGVAEEPETGIVGGHCDDPSALFDAAGHLHVVATCDPSGTDELIHATDASGAWVATPVPGPEVSFLARPRLALDPDGATLHLAWAGDVVCTSGVTSCDDIFYARSVGGAFSEPPVAVTSSDHRRDAHPAIGVDAHGRPIISFHRFDEPDALVYVSWSEDGVTFEPMVLVTQPMPGDQWFPATMVIDPATQLPEFVLERTIKDTDPLNTEMLRAYMTSP
jgi:hypothetical protein